MSWQVPHRRVIATRSVAVTLVYRPRDCRSVVCTVRIASRSYGPIGVQTAGNSSRSPIRAGVYDSIVGYLLSLLNVCAPFAADDAYLSRLAALARPVSFLGSQGDVLPRLRNPDRPDANQRRDAAPAVSNHRADRRANRQPHHAEQVPTVNRQRRERLVDERHKRAMGG